MLSYKADIFNIFLVLLITYFLSFLLGLEYIIKMFCSYKIQDIASTLYVITVYYQMLLKVVVPKTLQKAQKSFIIKYHLNGLHALVMKDLRIQHLIYEDGSDFSNHKIFHEVLTHTQVTGSVYHGRSHGPSKSGVMIFTEEKPKCRVN